MKGPRNTKMLLDLIRPQEENSLDVETEHIHTQNSSHAHYRVSETEVAARVLSHQQWNWLPSTSMPHFNRI